MTGGLAHFRFFINDFQFEVVTPFGWERVLDSALGAYYTSVGAEGGKWVRHTGTPERQGVEGLFEVYVVMTTRGDNVTVRVRQIGETAGGDSGGVRVGWGRRRGR